MAKSNGKRKSDPVPDGDGRTETDLLDPEADGSGAGSVSDPEGGPPAEMDVRLRGTPSAVAAGARRVAGAPKEKPEPEESEERPEPPVDRNIVLLADPQNMVIVTRQIPRKFKLASGREVVCSGRIVERFECPVTRAEIENEVFEAHGGRKYKVSIHPNTTTGEGKVLGAFTIEHPDPDALPLIPDPEGDAAALRAMQEEIPSGGDDPTLRETDPYAKAKLDLERRLERARLKKEIAELERMVKEAEGQGTSADAKPSAADAALARENAELKAQLAEKKQNEKFDGLQAQISELTKAVQAIATRPPQAPATDPQANLVIKMLDQSEKHANQMIEVIKSISKPAPVVAPQVSAEDNLDKMLTRFTKMKEAFGGSDSRVGRFQDQLLERFMERALDGVDGGGDPEEEDTLKFAIKQMTPVLKTYVEKQVEKEGDGGKSEVSKERVREIYEQAAQKAAQDLVKKWKDEGIVVADPRGIPQQPQHQRKPGIPTRPGPASRVVSRTKTSEGVVERVQIEPADLSKRPPKPPAPPQVQPSPSPTPREIPKEDEKVRYTEMPGIGKVEIPAQPGDMKYDRAKSVNYVLDSILSEISEGIPKRDHEKPESSSCVPSDALDYLDDEILSEIWKATSGPELETALGRWGDPARLEKIKGAGQDEKVSSWLRRVIRTIQDAWKDAQKETEGEAGK